MTGTSDGTRLNPLSVSALNEVTDLLLREQIGGVWIVGELSRFVAHRSGHWYFTLKDENATIDCAMFRGRNRGVAFDPQDGLEVLLFARPGVYVPRGRYQLVVETLEPRGRGAAALALEQLRAKLDAEGLFDPARRRPLPLVPQTIGIVTSTEGAALRDVLRVLERRFAGVDVLVAPSAVQGPSAAGEITRGIRALDVRGLDVLLVVRGGGAREDLAPFDDEAVVRAIASASTPIVTGIGHETDTTLADLAADRRAPTPSAAAEIIVRERVELRRRLGTLERALRGASLHRVEKARARLRLLSGSRGLGAVPLRVQRAELRLAEAGTSLARALERRLRGLAGRLQAARRRISPEGLRVTVGARRRTLDVVIARLDAGALRRVTDARERWGRTAARLHALSPLAVLDRGYALVTRATPDGSLVDDVAALRAGDRLHVRLRRGAADVVVEATHQIAPGEGAGGTA